MDYGQLRRIVLALRRDGCSLLILHSRSFSAPVRQPSSAALVRHQTHRRHQLLHAVMEERARQQLLATLELTPFVLDCALVRLRLPVVSLRVHLSLMAIGMVQLVITSVMVVASSLLKPSLV